MPARKYPDALLVSPERLRLSRSAIFTEEGTLPMKHDIIVLALLINAMALLVLAAAIVAVNEDARPTGSPEPTFTERTNQ